MKRIAPLRLTGIGGSLLFLLAFKAQAGPTVPAPYESYLLQAEYPEGIIQDQSGKMAGTFTDTLGSGGTIGTASTTITLGSDPSVDCSAYGTAGLGQGGLGFFDVTLTYGFEVLNLGEGTANSIPINITASGYANFAYSGSVIGGAVAASATWGVLAAGGQSLSSSLGLLGSVEASPTQTGNGVPASFGPITFPGSVSTSTVYGIYISITGNASGGNGDLAMATAFVDPQVQIDPTFPQASDYQIVYAPGVVPEPSAGAMLALGGVVLVCGGRWRGKAHS